MKRSCAPPRKVTLAAAAACGLATAPGHAGIAVTEFLNNPDGTDAGREWVELFNFSPVAVDVTGWVLGDEDGDAFVLPERLLPPGGYLVLVSGGTGGLDAATAKAVLELEWLGGAASDHVIGMAGVALANGADELVLRDAAGNIRWSLAWADDEAEARATFLTGSIDFSVSTFGDKEAPGVVRAGDDLGVPGFPGYEQNDAAADPLAGESDIASLALVFGEDYLNVAEPSTASPLAGAYRTIPPGDGDHDGIVNVADLLLLLAEWGECAGICPADFNGDGAVDEADVVLLLENWT